MIFVSLRRQKFDSVPFVKYSTAHPLSLKSSTAQISCGTHNLQTTRRWHRASREHYASSVVVFIRCTELSWALTSFVHCNLHTVNILPRIKKICNITSERYTTGQRSLSLRFFHISVSHIAVR